MPYPCMHTYIPTHRSTKTHLELFLHYVGPKSDDNFPPGPACPAGGPTQPSPISITPESSQDKLPPLSNPDENYVIPIEDAPAADYVNGDGGWGLGVAEKRGRGSRLTAGRDTPYLCPCSAFCRSAGGPEAQEVSPSTKGSGKASKATHCVQAR